MKNEKKLWKLTFTIEANHFEDIRDLIDRLPGMFKEHQKLKQEYNLKNEDFKNGFLLPTNIVDEYYPDDESKIRAHLQLQIIKD